MGEEAIKFPQKIERAANQKRVTLPWRSKNFRHPCCHMGDSSLHSLCQRRHGKSVQPDKARKLFRRHCTGVIHNGRHKHRPGGKGTQVGQHGRYILVFQAGEHHGKRRNALAGQSKPKRSKTVRVVRAIKNGQRQPLGEQRIRATICRNDLHSAGEPRPLQRGDFTFRMLRLPNRRKNGRASNRESRGTAPGLPLRRGNTLGRRAPCLCP